MPARRFDLAQLRVRNQLLVGTLSTPADVVGWFGAVQAQEFGGAKWALALRTRGALDRDVEQAVHRAAIVRTHVLRPTWHFVLPGDLRWLLALTAPRIKQAMAYHDRQLGLDGRIVGRSNDAIADALSGGKHLTRSDLGQVLARVEIPASGQRLGQLMLHAELDAVICSGARRGKQFTYALVCERCPDEVTISRDEALGRLASRYFTSHGPALVADFAWWSGLTASDARRGIELARPKLSSRAIDDRTYWFAEPAAPAQRKPPRIRLLPSFDEYLVAYKARDAVIDPAAARRFGTRIELLLSQVVVRDGRVIGLWRRTLQPRAVALHVRLFASLDRSARQELAAAVEQYGRFLELPVRLTTGR